MQRPGANSNNNDINAIIEDFLNSSNQLQAQMQDYEQHEQNVKEHKKIPRYDIYDPKYGHIRQNLQEADPNFKRRPFPQADQ